MAVISAPIVSSTGGVQPINAATAADDAAARAAAGPAPGPDGFYRARTPQEAATLAARGVDPSKILTLQNAGGGGNVGQYYTGTDPNAIHTETKIDSAGNQVTIQVRGDGGYNLANPATRAFNSDQTVTNAPNGGKSVFAGTPFKVLGGLAGGAAGFALGGPLGAAAGAKLGYSGAGALGNATSPGPPSVVSGQPATYATPGNPAGGGPGATPASIAPVSAAASQSLVNQFNNAYQNYQPINSPVAQAAQLAPQSYASAAQLGPQMFANAGQVGYVPQVQAPNVGQAQQVQAAQVGSFLQAAGYAVQAGTATAQQITALERVQPGIVGQIQQASASQVGALIKGVAQQAVATTLDLAPQNEFRSDQKTLVGYLNDAINGTAPSVAKLQLDDATQRNEANQLGIAAAASRGGNSALAMRTAANNIGMINQKAAADAALLRAQEIATARGQYGDVANAGRTTDVNIAGQNAGLLTGVSQSNAQLGTQVSLANALNDLNKQQTNATLSTSVSQTNAKNQLDAQSLQAQLNQQASTANAGNFLAAQQTNATLGTQASIANANNVTAANTATANNYTQASVANANNSLAAQIAQAKLTQDASTSNAANATTLQALQANLLYNASHDNAGNALSAAQTNANLQTQASVANANNATTINTTQGQLTNAANLANAANATNLNINQGQLTNAANLANAGNAVTTAGQNITARQNSAGNVLTAQGQVNAVGMNTANNQTSLAQAQLVANASKDAATTDFYRKLAVAGIKGAADSLSTGDPTSDRRAKTSIRDGRGDAQDLLDALKARSYRYKDPTNGEGDRTGIMAQDMEKTKAGRALVRDTPTGKKLDPSQGFGTVMAMLATLNERVKKVEGRRG